MTNIQRAIATALVLCTAMPLAASAQTSIASSAAPAVAQTVKAYTFTIAPGAKSALITPPANVPVAIRAVQLTQGYRGVASTTLLRIAGQFLEWTGIESPAVAAIASGFGSGVGQHILYVDYGHKVDLQVASADSFVVNNAGSYTATVKVVLTY